MTSILHEFLKNNPPSILEVDEKGQYSVQRPWNDESLRIRIPDTSGSLVASLNSLYLPPRLSAIYHRKERTLEFIYSVLEQGDPLRRRRFLFHYGGQDYTCYFGDATDILLSVAETAEPTSIPPLSNWRNLREIALLRRMEKRDSAKVKSIATSFFIAEVEWDEQATPAMLQHLNFYMRYFDKETPLIQVWSDVPNDRQNKQERLPFGTFPKDISARSLDPFLLRLWESTLGPDPFRRFLHNYQILEYAAFYYLKDDVLSRLKRILAAPETALRSSEAAKEILDISSEMKMEDEHKIVQVVKQFVNPETVWAAIKPNLEFFSSPVEFEGGATIEPLTKAAWSLEDFKVAWIPAFPEKLRLLRNAMAHAREKRMARVLLPTRANSGRLQLWVEPLQVAAMEVMTNWGAMLG